MNKKSMSMLKMLGIVAGVVALFFVMGIAVNKVKNTKETTETRAMAYTCPTVSGPTLTDQEGTVSSVNSISEVFNWTITGQSLYKAVRICADTQWVLADGTTNTEGGGPLSIKALRPGYVVKVSGQQSGGKNFFVNATKVQIMSAEAFKSATGYVYFTTLNKAGGLQSFSSTYQDSTGVTKTITIKLRGGTQCLGKDGVTNITCTTIVNGDNVTVHGVLNTTTNLIDGPSQIIDWSK